MAISSVTLTPESITDAADFVSDARAIADLMIAEGETEAGVDPEIIKLRRAAMTIWRILGQAENILDEGRG